MKSMKLMIKIFNVICNSILTIIILFGIIFIGLFCVGIVPYVVESGSMEPTIHTGSVCFINKNADYNDMKVGDIIAFRLNSGACATHRIVSVSEYGFETKGDANEAVDNLVTNRDNYMGKNVFSIPKAGFVVKALQTVRGKIVLGTVIVALLVMSLFFRSGRKEE